MKLYEDRKTYRQNDCKILYGRYKKVRVTLYQFYRYPDMAVIGSEKLWYYTLLSDDGLVEYNSLWDLQFYDMLGKSVRAALRRIDRIMDSRKKKKVRFIKKGYENVR